MVRLCARMYNLYLMASPSMLVTVAGGRLNHGDIVGAIADGQAARARARHLPLRQPRQPARPAQHIAAPPRGGRGRCVLRLMHAHIFSKLAAATGNRQSRRAYRTYPLVIGEAHGD